jgi:hypothetical protein
MMMKLSPKDHRPPFDTICFFFFFFFKKKNEGKKKNIKKFFWENFVEAILFRIWLQCSYINDRISAIKI